MHKSCMVVCNSPPFGLPSRECADDYFDKTVEELAEEMGQKVISTVHTLYRCCGLNLIGLKQYLLE